MRKSGGETSEKPPLLLLLMLTRRRRNPLRIDRSRRILCSTYTCRSVWMSGRGMRDTRDLRRTSGLPRMRIPLRIASVLASVEKALSRFVVIHHTQIRDAMTGTLFFYFGVAPLHFVQGIPMLMPLIKGCGVVNPRFVTGSEEVVEEERWDRAEISFLVVLQWKTDICTTLVSVTLMQIYQ